MSFAATICLAKIQGPFYIAAKYKQDLRLQYIFYIYLLSIFGDILNFFFLSNVY